MNRKWFVLLLSLIFAACSVSSAALIEPVSSPEATLVSLPTPSATPVHSSASAEIPSASTVPLPTALVTPSPAPEPTAKPTPKPTPKPTSEPVVKPVATPKPKSTFTMNLYSGGAFVQQKTNYWCVPTSTQIMINIIKHRKDHSYATQSAIWKVAWANIKYTGFKAQVYGSDPQGWVAALESFGGGNYKWVNSKSFEAALKSAVKALAVTGRPVGLSVMTGHHAWVLHGFVATADPRKTDKFTVLAVYVTAPGYGLFSYDVKPNTKLSVEQFKTRLRKYHSKLTKEVWEGYYVTIQPVK